MKKKIISVFLFLFIAVGLTGCGSNGSDEGSKSEPKKELEASDLEIEDFKYETKLSDYDGEECYLLSLTNNSDYDIIGVEFGYKVKNDVTDSQLLVYEDFTNRNSDIEDNPSLRKVIIAGGKNQSIRKGEKLTNIDLYLGYDSYFWYDRPSIEQFDLMEPEALGVGIVNDNKMYIGFYDFEKKAWQLNSTSESVDIWTTNEIGKEIEKPSAKHFVTINDDEDLLKFKAYGISSDDYNEYVKTLKSSGFVEAAYDSTYFEGTNTNGYYVEVWYDESAQNFAVTVEKIS